MTTFRGGGKIGSVSSSWPFVTLDINERELRLSIVLDEVALKRESIVKVACKRRLLVSAIRIEHSNPLVKQRVEFWTFSPDAVLHELRSKGYPTA